jgi:hypothetical protein
MKLNYIEDNREDNRECNENSFYYPLTVILSVMVFVVFVVFVVLNIRTYA